MLLIDNVTKRYGNFTAVDGASLSLPSGTIHGFLGPNGAGKTTTMKMICGLIKPTSGQILVDGYDVQREPLEVKRRIGYIPDRPHVYDRLSALEYMYFIAGLYQMDKETAKTASLEQLELFGLSHVKDHLLESFSHGMKQRVVMASVLMHNPRLMIVDEPMVGLDPQGARLLKDVLRQKASEGMTIMLSTHTLEVADEVCDEVTVIQRGRIIAQGSPEALRTQTGSEGRRLEEVFLQLTAEAEVSDP